MIQRVAATLVMGLLACESDGLGQAGSSTTNHLEVCSERPACGPERYTLEASPATYQACVEHHACDGDQVWLTGGTYDAAVSVARSVEIRVCAAPGQADAPCEGAPASLTGALTATASATVRLAHLNWASDAPVALTAEAGAHLHVDGGRIGLTPDAGGTALLSENASVTLTDVRVTDTQGFGVVSRGGALTWSGGELAGYRGVAVFAEDTTITLDGLRVHGGQGDRNAGLNRTHALVTVGESTLEATALAIEAGADEPSAVADSAGLLVAGGTAELRDVRVSGLTGFGAWFQDAADVTWAAGQVQQVGEVGLGFFNVAGGTLRDLRVQAIRPVNLISDGLQWQRSEGPFALSQVAVDAVERVGLVVDVAEGDQPPRFTLDDVSVTGAAQAGVYVQGAEADLLGGVSRSEALQEAEGALRSAGVVFELPGAAAIPDQ